MELGTKIRCLMLNERGLGCLHCSSSAFERFVVTVSPNLSSKQEPVNDFTYPEELLPQGMFISQKKIYYCTFSVQQCYMYEYNNYTGQQIKKKLYL